MFGQPPDVLTEHERVDGIAEAPTNEDDADGPPDRSHGPEADVGAGEAVFALETPTCERDPHDEIEVGAMCRHHDERARFVDLTKLLDCSIVVLQDALERVSMSDATEQQVEVGEGLAVHRHHLAEVAVGVGRNPLPVAAGLGDDLVESVAESGVGSDLVDHRPSSRVGVALAVRPADENR